MDKVKLVIELVASFADLRPENALVGPCAIKLGFPPPSSAYISPPYLLILCDKAFALLDAVDLPAPADRASRKAVIVDLKAAEKRVEQWKQSFVAPSSSCAPSHDPKVEQLGRRVRIYGLVSAPENNGRIGEVVVGVVDGRVTVKLEQVEEPTFLRVKVKNLETL
jgi:hypothetical protein